MTDNTQPETLRLADELERKKWHVPACVMQAAAEELRHKHARIAELEAQLEAIGAGGVEPLRRRECLHQIVEPAPAAQGDAEDAAKWRVINEQFIDDYLEDYELVGEAEGVGDCSYTPTETERDLIKDAALGLLSCAEDAARSQAKEGA